MMDGMSIADEFDAAAKPEDASSLDMEIDITVDRKRFTVLHLEEPKAKQIERAERELNTQTPTPWHFRKYQMALIAAVAKVPPEVVGELTNTQILQAWSFLRAKLEPDSPPTGES